MTTPVSPSLTSLQDFAPTPSGYQKRWIAELTAAKKAADKWRRAGERITKVFLDERGGDENLSQELRGGTRLNVFSANIITLRAMMFGNVPRVEVGRRFQDANDDVARVAAEMLERGLNKDIGEEFSFGIGAALDDRLLVGLGCARVAYEAQFESIHHDEILDDDNTTLAPAYDEERKTFEA